MLLDMAEAPEGDERTAIDGGGFPGLTTKLMRGAGRRREKVATHWWRRGKPRREEDDLRLYSPRGTRLSRWIRLWRIGRRSLRRRADVARGGRRDAGLGFPALQRRRDGPLWWEEAHESAS